MYCLVDGEDGTEEEEEFFQRNTSLVQLSDSVLSQLSQMMIRILFFVAICVAGRGIAHRTGIGGGSVCVITRRDFCGTRSHFSFFPSPQLHKWWAKAFRRMGPVRRNQPVVLAYRSMPYPLQVRRKEQTRLEGVVSWMESEIQTPSFLGTSSKLVYGWLR